MIRSDTDPASRAQILGSVFSIHEPLFHSEANEYGKASISLRSAIGAAHQGSLSTVSKIA